MIFHNVVRQLPRVIESIVALSIIGGLLLLASILLLACTFPISGKVISANTKMPLNDVMIAIESDVPFNYEKGFGSYVKTNKNGEFKAKAKGKILSISAWKPGYALSGITAGYAHTLLGRALVIELREMTPSHWIPERESSQGIVAGSGFSFERGKVVGGHHPDADFVLRAEAGSPCAAYVETYDEGGVIFQPYGQGEDFYNTPKAPLTGYSNRLPIHRKQIGIYYIRTRDGKHYAKLRLFSGGQYTDRGEPIDYRLQWAYQPDGTRDLEIMPGEHFPFPLEKFGLKRDSVTR